MTDDDLLALCIWDEAADQPHEGKVAVGRVIRNRMALKYESDGTVAGTVLKRFQFSGFWFAMKAGHYQEVEFDLAGAQARAEDLFMQAKGQLVWADCLDAVADSADPHFAWGPEGMKLAAEPRTVLYANLALCSPPWATPDREVAKIYAHTFFRD
ncbi:MAG TPA: hypothetical protein VGS12_00680 [Caulobacteraceae bacterium]|nr:hypothetical protein [Caulobacteraceae bacterium]